MTLIQTFYFHVSTRDRYVHAVLGRILDFRCGTVKANGDVLRMMWGNCKEKGRKIGIKFGSSLDLH